MDDTEEVDAGLLSQATSPDTGRDLESEVIEDEDLSDGFRNLKSSKTKGSKSKGSNSYYYYYSYSNSKSSKGCKGSKSKGGYGGCYY